MQLSIEDSETLMSIWQTQDRLLIIDCFMIGQTPSKNWHFQNFLFLNLQIKFDSCNFLKIINGCKFFISTETEKQ